MPCRCLAAALVATLLCSASVAHGQKATERFIPIGQSPGVSGKLSLVGTIASVDAEERTIEVEASGERIRVTIPEPTPIWIDRHARGLAPVTGAFEDCRAGRTVEVRYADPDSRRGARWVKLGAD